MTELIVDNFAGGGGEVRSGEENMIDVNYTDYATKATMTLEYEEIEFLTAFIRSHEWQEIPDTVKGEILPKMEEFLAENY